MILSGSIYKPLKEAQSKKMERAVWAVLGVFADITEYALTRAGVLWTLQAENRPGKLTGDLLVSWDWNLCISVLLQHF